MRPPPRGFRWLAIWLFASFVSFFALSARADVPPPHITEPTVGASAGKGLVKKDGFGGLTGSGQVTGGTSGRLPTTGSGQQTNPGAASGSGSGQLTISGSVEVAGAASPSITDRIGDLFSQADDLVEGAIDSDVGRIVGATLVNPVAGVLTFAGQQMEADGARTGDGNLQVAGALTSMPGDFGQGILNVGYDTIKGLGGLVINGVETQVRVVAAGATGNQEALTNALGDSQIINLGEATGTWVADNVKTEARIVAAVATGNTAALTNALGDSQTVQFVTDAVNSGGDGLADIRHTITNGTAAERAELIHSTGRVAGEVTAEVAMVVIPGGGGVRVASTAGRLAPAVVKAEEAAGAASRVVGRTAEGAAAREAPRLTEYASSGHYPTSSMLDVYRGENSPLTTRWSNLDGTPSPVRYLTDAERAPFAARVENGRLVDARGRPLDTRGGATVVGQPGESIYVMDANGRLYTSTYQEVGKFHHSSLAGGQDVAAAGTIRVENGRLIEVSNSSGHYRPVNEQTMRLIEELKRQGLDVSGVTVYDIATGTRVRLP